MGKVVKDRQLRTGFRRNWLLLTVAGMAGGCAPFSATPPFHFAETATVLQSGEVGVTAAGGVGGMGLGAKGVGLGLRARVGVGGGQEVGAEATVIHVTDGDNPTAEMPWQGESDAFAAKLSWKIAMARWIAFVLGAGGSHSATGDAIGGDVSLIASIPDPWGPFRPFLGVRTGLAVPVGRDSNEAGGFTQGVTVGLGTTLAVSDTVDLVGEGGLLGAWSHGYHTTVADPERDTESKSEGGVYVLLGAALRFR
jgi:hypothetical protein